ncbi:MAG: helix-turn-helix domain-containing protein [Clostridia bacterium]|nr:helix-turn-helix domain-containing protein [Clostridia bacterium]
MEQETYLERIKKLKSSRKITNDKLSEMTGIPLGTLSKLLAGISDSPKLSNIVAISRALDCSLDWLITGVPENTNNYTLEPAEITLVETYRELDSYGQALTLAVMDMERTRAMRQSDEEAIKLHDVARRTARRGGARLRRPEEPAENVLVGVSNELFRVSAEDEAEAVKTSPVEVAAPAALTAADLIRGGGEATTASAEASAETAVPRSLLTRSTDLPAGLRRRSIGLYDMPVSAGVGEFLADSTRAEDIVIPDDPRTAEADYALRINGDSMEPKYHSGDILLIQTADAVEEGELGIFVLDGSGYFKKYGGDHLISLNPKYPPILLKDFEDVSCCGRVVGKLKRK